MDTAYDHIAERTYSNSPDRSSTTTPKPSTSDDNTTESNTPTSSTVQPRANLQTEFQETFRAFSASPWGAKLGGWWSSAQKQGAAAYEVARREAEKREAEAARVLEDARRKALVVVEGMEDRLDAVVNEERRAEDQAQAQRKRKEQEQTAQADPEVVTRNTTEDQEEQEDTETFLNRFKTEAAKRLKEVQKAEDAADEALLRFGSNIRSFLRDTISIAAPEPSSTANSSDVLFESKDSRTGKRVIHTSRFDAQLHVIHTTPSSFTHDPDGSEGEWEKFRDAFDVEMQTERVAGDLEKYPELRAAMERLVPESVEYRDFWRRYYFLRHVVEVREEKRREMLRGECHLMRQSSNVLVNCCVSSTEVLTSPCIASADQPDEQVAWDEDSDSEADHTATSNAPVAVDVSEISAAPPQPQPGNTMSTSHTRTDSDAMTLRPSRRSHDEKSVADSEASYDLVSGAASHADGSPRGKAVNEEESDDDWE